MQKSCYWCKKVFNKPGDVLKYDDKLFCDEVCLGAYLVDKVDSDIETEWIDTPENIYMCEMEKRAEY